ncbi:MAG: UPF0280 family protein [Candidatus Saganbacteria bacterium]|nr:UPF0280 family protein [Candidatus Saganbacteria bacterium]
MFEPRTYRQQLSSQDLISFTVIEKETDLLILANRNLKDQALELVKKYRLELETYIAQNPIFQSSLAPVKVSFFSPKIVKEMAKAGEAAKVGPMAAVAGAVAEFVGRGLLKYSQEIIVENGGDIFMRSEVTRRIGVFAGVHSPFTHKIAIEIDPSDMPLGVCTSAGTVGHSLSFGKADAVVTIAKSTALADAAATAIGNLVKTVQDIEKGLELATRIRGLKGALIIKDDQLGVRGKMRIVKT